MLYIICGLPGTGKTMVAKEAASITGAVVLRTDEFRKRLFPHPTYSADEKGQVYDALLKEATSLLRDGRDVIIDATFHRSRERESAEPG